MTRYLPDDEKAQVLAHAIRGLSEALAFHQQVRTAPLADRLAVGSDDLEWLRQASQACVDAAADMGYHVKRP